MSIDKRKHPRQPSEEKIFIELLSASEEDTEDNVLIECTTRDISACGMKIHSNLPFMSGSVLELLINFESGGYKFLLTAEVKWCQSQGDNDYLAGFELLDSEHSDFIVWQRMFSS